MSSIEVNKTVVHYREWGSGDSILIMLHGWPADSGHYKELGPLLAKSGYRVIVPDLPGWGNTPAPEKAWNVSEYRDWVHDFITELGFHKYSLFGHSFGGRVSIKYAVKYATEIDKLILCAAAGIKPDPYTVKRRALKIGATVGKKLFNLPLINRIEPFAKKVLYRLAGSNDYLKVEGVMKETIVNVLEEDLSPLMPQVHPQTLLLWGSEDGATPIADAKTMSKLLPNATLTVFEGQRHNLPKNAPELVSHAVSNFLK
jgi:pimeloyl-ACP methyl ester carboxylesterase